MPTVKEVADTYIVRMAASDPISATSWGVPGHDGKLPDLSPEGFEERAHLQRAALVELGRVPHATDDDRIAAEVMAERLAASVELHDSGDHYRSLRVIGSPPQSIRQSFDLMATEDDDDWQNVASRLRAVPAALEGYRATLNQGLTLGLVSARRQVRACQAQCATWGGRGDEQSSFFSGLVRRYPGASLQVELEQAARQAAFAYVELSAWLGDHYSGGATEVDAVGRERYGSAARYFTGSDLDLDDTYEFGWNELHRIEGRMREVCDQIAPGATLAEAVDRLESDPSRVIEGVEAFQRWNQDLIDTTIAELNGVHFDIAEPIRRCEAMIAPPGGAAAMYYTGPSEDLARPGRTWYPTMGKTRFPLWREVSICYHEGVPGHHLQIAQVRYLADRLTPVPAAGRVHVGSRRGVGPVRGTPHGRARLPRRSRLRARNAQCPGDAGGARRSWTSGCTSSFPSPLPSVTTPVHAGRPSWRFPS